MQMRMARDLLEGSGIECFVFDRENSRMFGSSPSFPIRLMVHASVAEDARTRLKDLGFPNSPYHSHRQIRLANPQLEAGGYQRLF